MKKISPITVALLVAALVFALSGFRGRLFPSAPFAADKLTVLVVEESNPGQTPAWVIGNAPTAIRGWVESHGGDFRILDKDQTDLSQLAPKWQAAMQVDRKTLPWIVAAGTQTGFSKPLHGSAAEAIRDLEGVK